VKNAWPLALLCISAGPAENTDWSQFRGPNRDGISPDTGLLKEWPSGGPALAWKATGLGEGSRAVDPRRQGCLHDGRLGGRLPPDLPQGADGKIVWTPRSAHWAREAAARTRGTPATDGTLVDRPEPDGDIVCAEAATGKEKWQEDS
jgi:hypothetical protein